MSLSPEVVASFDFFDNKDVTAITAIKVGLCNQNYRVDYHGGHVLFRVCGEGASAQQRQYEYAAQNAAYRINIAPKPLKHYPCSDTPPAFNQWCEQSNQINCGVMISEFFDGGRWSDLKDISDESLAKLATQMASLHQMDFSLDEQPHDGLVLLASYWQCYQDKGPVEVERYQRLTSQLSSLVFTPDCMTHRDLNATNILTNGQQQVIIDWEFCGAGDRYLDLATVIIELGLNHSQLDRLLTCYQQQSTSDVLDSEKLAQCQLYYVAVCWLWQPESITAQAWLEQRDSYGNKLDYLLSHNS